MTFLLLRKIIEISILFLKLKKGLKTWIIKIVFFGSMALNSVCLSKYNCNIPNDSNKHPFPTLFSPLIPYRYCGRMIVMKKNTHVFNYTLFPKG